MQNNRFSLGGFEKMNTEQDLSQATTKDAAEIEELQEELARLTAEIAKVEQALENAKV